MIDYLVDGLAMLGALVWLAIGSLVARANARRAFESCCAKWQDTGDRSTAYYTKISGYVVGWPLVLIGNFVNKPIGDVTTALQCYEQMQEQIALGRKELH